MSFGKSFLEGLSTGANVRLARDQRDLNKLTIEQKNREAAQAEKLQAFRNELEGYDPNTNMHTGTVHERVSGPPIPEREAEKIGVTPGAPTQAVEQQTRGAAKLRQMLMRASALGDKQAVEDTSRMLGIAVSRSWNDYKRTKDPSGLTALGEDLGLPLKTNAEGQLISIFDPKGERAITDENEFARMDLYIAKMASDPIAAAQEFLGQDREERKVDVDEKNAETGATNAETRQIEADDALALGAEKARLLEKDIDKQTEYYKALQAARTANNGNSGFSNESFSSALKTTGENLLTLINNEGLGEDYWGGLDKPATLESASSQMTQFAMEAVADHNTPTAAATAAKGASLVTRYLHGDPDVDFELGRSRETGAPLIRMGRETYFIGNNAFNAVKKFKNDQAGARAARQGPRPALGANLDEPGSAGAYSPTGAAQAAPGSRILGGLRDAVNAGGRPYQAIDFEEAQ